jgi:hypothetical protein
MRQPTSTTTRGGGMSLASFRFENGRIKQFSKPDPFSIVCLAALVRKSRVNP